MKYKHLSLGAALGWKYNHAPGIMTYDGVLHRWPERLGPRPTDAEQAQAVADWEALPPEEKDPRLKLKQDITNATTIAQLKQILMKVVG